MPDIQLQPAMHSEQPILNALMQLYLHDFSSFDGAKVDERGLFHYGSDLSEYWTPGHWPYLARVDGQLAGFALVDDRIEHRRGPGRMVVEFFVLRSHRRQGIGRTMARAMFDAYRGYWEVAEIKANTPAQAFWRRVIDEYTAGRYREFETVEGERRIVWQVFDSAAWASATGA